MRQILLVEDEAPLRHLLSTFLGSQGYAVHAVEDGRLAAAWMNAHALDLLITDLCMPGFDGMELLVELRKRRSPVPAIVISGGLAGEMDWLLRASVLLGARRTFAKPFALHELVSAVRALVG
jgi:DNA-binding response OmpR family regulator